MAREEVPVGERLLTAMTILVAALVVLAIVGIVTRDASGQEGESSAGDPFVARISLSEFSITGDLTVPTGPVVLEVVNDGSAEHNLVLRNSTLRTPDLGPGETYRLDLGTVSVGTFEVYCDIAGHEAAGMVAMMTVAPEGSNIESSAGHGHGDRPDWAALDQAMVDSMMAFPAETEGRGNQPLQPTIAADGALEFTLTVEIIEWEVEPGKFVDAWAYNGQVPGPAIHVGVGDHVRITVDNRLPMSTDVHWHGIRTPNEMDGVAPYTQDLIGPGETFVYEFTTQDPSVGMYHAHHHAQMQVPNGLFGTFIIGEHPIPYGQTISGREIPEDLELALEIPMVLNDAGVIGYSLNGKSFPATDPYVVNQGDWVLIHYYNEGLQIHPMHLHQFPQLVFSKDGIPLDHPYWVDTLNVAPGERYSVLVNTADPGTWVWHCHILTHVERDEGMFGMVTAFVVQES